MIVGAAESNMKGFQPWHDLIIQFVKKKSSWLLCREWNLKATITSGDQLGVSFSSSPERR